MIMCGVGCDSSTKKAINWLNCVKTVVMCIDSEYNHDIKYTSIHVPIFTSYDLIEPNVFLTNLRVSNLRVSNIGKWLKNIIQH